MLKRIAFLLITGMVLFLSGCPVQLTSSMASDFVLMLGRFNPTGTSDIRAAEGGNIEVPVLVTDQTGNAASGNYDIVFTLSIDADLDTTGDNIEAGTATVSAGIEEIVSIEVPASSTAANYTLFGVVNVEDAAENNNKSSITLIIGTENMPDLTIVINDSAEVLPDWAEPEVMVLIGYKITNAGYTKIEAGASFKIEFVVNILTNDEQMGLETITLEEDLYPQDFITGQAEVSLPELGQMAADAGVSTDDLGEYNVVYTVTVDSEDEVIEINEGGTDTFTITSGNRKPDLLISNMSFPEGFSAAKIGDPADIALMISNDGRLSTGEYSVILYVDLDDDAAYTAEGDSLIFEWAVADTPSVPYDVDNDGIMNNNVYLYTDDENSVYSDDIDPGIYNMRAEIITEVDEYDDANNDFVEPNVTFNDQFVNLTMTYMSSDLEGALAEADGGTIRFTYILANDEIEDLEDDFDVSFYANKNGTFDTGSDILLGTDTVTSSIPSGESVEETFDAVFPGSSGAAFYTVYWVIDPENAVNETNEDDNTPDSANACFVFPVVTDETSDIDTRLIAYKPMEAESANTRIDIYYYNTLWTAPASRLNSGATAPGSLYDYVENNSALSTTGTAGLYFTTSDDDVPVTFRLVPTYVSALPEAVIPDSSGGQDGYEINDSEGEAFALPESENPFYGFVTIWLDSADSDEYDYFTFDVP